VPNAVGAQEGAYLVIGTLFGLAPDTVLRSGEAAD
jgi:hypothetical protein